MWRGRRAEAAKICAHAVGVGNLILLVLGEPTTLTLSLAVALTPFTLATALKLTTFVTCNMVSLALGDGRERAELLVCAIGGVQPPSEGEKYREAMLAEIRAAPSHQLRAIGANLMKTAPKTILGAWVRLPRPLRERARNAVGSSTGHPGS
jgi:hypothetical protein